MLDFPTNIRQALAEDQDAYTRLHAAVLPLAKYKIAGDRALAHDAPWLIYEATAHVLMSLHQCAQPERFIAWAFKVIKHYYQRVYRQVRRHKNRMMALAVSLDEPEYESREGKENEARQIICTKSHARQLEAHIDATDALSRLPESIGTCAVKFEMYGHPQSPRSTMTYVRKVIRTGEYLCRPVNHSFALPAMVL